MADNKNKKPTRVTPQRPAAATASSPYGAMPKIDAKEIFKKHRSTFIVLGLVLLLIIVFAISSSLSKIGKYDIYSLNSELNIPSVQAEYKSFIQTLADSSEAVGGYVKNGVEDRDIALAAIADSYDELLCFGIPEKLTGIKAAALDMLSTHYKYISGISGVNSERLNEVNVNLSTELAKVIK